MKATATILLLILSNSKDLLYLNMDLFINIKFDQLPFDGEAANFAVKYHLGLKIINKQIDLPDLLIGGTAKRFNRHLATLNKKH